MNSELPYWLAAAYLPRIGLKRVKHWLTQMKSLQAFFTASCATLTEIGVTAAELQAIQELNWQAIEKDLQWSHLPDRHIITWQDEAYPFLLKQIAQPPLLLFVRGNLAALTAPQIALVGARSASVHGVKNAEYFARSLAAAGFTITSGLALGVDAASHRGALQAKGITIGVAGTGLNHIYPHQHLKLADEMVTTGGAIVSEFPLEIPPIANNFPRRNRIIAGLSKGVLVIEAALKSGSLITARMAASEGREVFALPGSIHSPLARGCHHLIKQGAKLVETVSDILEELQWPCAVTMSTPKQSLPEPPYLPVYNLIGYELTTIDMIISHHRLTVDELSSILLTLELAGYIQSVPGGYIRTIV